jgi:methionine-rich copper-binding protein CopC
MSRTIAILLTAVLGLGATAASAHPRLQASNPASGTTLTTSPKDIRMTFSEELVPSFTGLELKSASGKSVATDKAKLVPGDNRSIVVPIMSRLAVGTYSVSWHAVSVDTHRISGSYKFKIRQ